MFGIRASVLVVLAVFTVGAVAGCGGGGSSSSSNSGGGGATPSKKEFAQSADQICADITKRVAALNLLRPRSATELTQFINNLKATVNDGINRLQALKRPTGTAGATALRFTDELDREYKQQVLPALNQLEQAVLKRDRKALRDASSKLKKAQNQKSTLFARQAGANKCAKP